MRSSRRHVGASALPRVRILAGSAIAIGPGKAQLLHAIDETGSISAAGRGMRMSYRRAWLLVRTMNECFQSPLVEAEKGGAGRRRASDGDGPPCARRVASDCSVRGERIRPILEARPLSGDTISLGGNSPLTILNVWATWCTSCREEMADLEVLHRELSSRGRTRCRCQRRCGQQRAGATIRRARGAHLYRCTRSRAARSAAVQDRRCAGNPRDRRGRPRPVAVGGESASRH